ncbi:MAG TPA: penicillin acylase family protein [Burkholderiaceae bacterium]|nr:penicillin acylase family protein [Burkholderiaceae bacterium]
MRVLRWLLATVSIVLIAMIGLWFWYRQASLPEHEGTLAVGALSRPVKIVRDDAGLPTISAQTESDALFALGYVHAQDRLWQIEFNRRIGQGRIAEIVGPAGVDTDRFLRTLGVYRQAQAMAHDLDPESRTLAEAYCAGINAYLDGHDGLPQAEFVLLRAPHPEHWVPADVLAWTLMMSWDLSADAMRSELERLRLSERLSKAEIDDFLPGWDESAPATADYVDLYHRLGLPGHELADQAHQLAQQLPDFGFGVAQAEGSNSWVVGGSRTVSGRPLLANDPHLALSTPSVWYFARVKAPGLDVFGATLPGVPFVVLGRNAHVAWGFTTTYADTQDLYLERIDPDHPDQYQTPGGYAPFETRVESIRVRGADPVLLTVRSTRHGPVITGALASADAALKAGPRSSYVLALRWASLEPGAGALHAFRAMNRAADTQQFDRALRGVTLVVQNVVFAGDDGHIGFRVIGRVPVRRPDNDLHGLVPSPGWDARYDWQGWIDPDDLPRSLDPPQAVIVTANQKITPPGYPRYITMEWRAPYRADRIEQLLQSVPRHDVASFEQIQADVTSLAAREMMRALAGTEPATPVGRAALQRLRAWDGAMRADAPEPLLYQAWMRRLKHLIFDDKLGALAQDLVEPVPLTTAMLRVLTGRAHARSWCDDAAVPERHVDCAVLAARALDEAAGELAREPRDLERLQWGRSHAAVFEHRPFSSVAPLRRWFEQRVRDAGDDDTINRAVLRLRGEHPFEARAAPSMRAIYDLSGSSAGVWMVAPGQSGNPFSPQFGDLLEAWSKVRYRPIGPPVGGVLTLTLKPSPLGR